MFLYEIYLGQFVARTSLCQLRLEQSLSSFPKRYRSPFLKSYVFAINYASKLFFNDLRFLISNG